MATLRALLVLSEAGDVVFSRYVSKSGQICTICFVDFRFEAPSISLEWFFKYFHRRKWPTVERRAKLLYGAEYEPIPSDSDLKAPLMGEIRRNDLTSFPGPVIALKNGRLWPLVFINKV